MKVILAESQNITLNSVVPCTYFGNIASLPASLTPCLPYSHPSYLPPSFSPSFSPFPPPSLSSLPLFPSPLLPSVSPSLLTPLPPSLPGTLPQFLPPTVHPPLRSLYSSKFTVEIQTTLVIEYTLGLYYKRQRFHTKTSS